MNWFSTYHFIASNLIEGALLIAFMLGALAGLSIYALIDSWWKRTKERT